MGWFRVLVETWWWVLIGAAIGFASAWFLQRANVAAARRSRVEAEAGAAIIRTEADSRLERSDDRLNALTRRLRDRDGDVEELEHARLRDNETIAKLKADSVRHLGQVDQRDEALHKYRIDLANQSARVAQLERALEASRVAPPRIDLRGHHDGEESTAKPGPAGEQAAGATVPIGLPGPVEAGVRGVSAGAALGLVDTADVVDAPVVESGFDADAAAAAMGRKVVHDDLTLIEGIGPKIASLLDMAGVHTWRGLASASATTLHDVLEEGGPSFRMHDPTTWPEQAQLAADGRFGDLATMQRQLSGGRL